MTDSERIKRNWKDAKEGNANWKEEAKDSYRFVAGWQWNEDDQNELEEDGKPAITFNRCDVFIDAISGLEINNRQAIHYYPREQGDTGVNEVFTAAVKWVRDETDAEAEESEAFRDAAICGIGPTRTRMDYSEDQQGKILVERVDPIHIWPDPTARKRCLSDRRYTFHGEYMDRTEAERRWPDEYLPEGDPEAPTVVNTDTNWLYKDTDANIFETESKVFVLYYEEVRQEPYYVALNPGTRKLEELTEDSYQKIERVVEKRGIKKVKKYKNCYYRTFCKADGTPLEPLEKSPIQDFDYKFITFKRDRSKGCWYGLVRAMKDPQRWANKWLSQILHIVNSNAKGGTFAEAGAFADPRKAEEDWSKDSPLILLREGGIDKIKERTPAPYPSGLDKLMMLAFNSLPFVTGINLEMLGLADREQAGVLESQRRQSAFTILAPLFDALKQYRKEEGSLLLKYIREFLTDGRLIRIIGQNGAVQYVPLVADEDTATYDVIIDQSPDSPDFKKQLWEMLQTMLPAMMKAGYPIPPSVIKYIPSLPLDLANEWMAYVQQSMNQIPPEQMQAMQEAHQKAMEELQKLKEENLSLKLDKSAEVMKIQSSASKAEQDAALKASEIQNERILTEVNLLKLQQEMAKGATDAEMKNKEIQSREMIEMVKNDTTAQIQLIQTEAKERIEALKLESAEYIAQLQAAVKEQEQQIKAQEQKIKATEEEGKKPKRAKVKRTKDGYEVEQEGKGKTKIKRTPTGFEIESN